MKKYREKKDFERNLWNNIVYICFFMVLIISVILSMVVVLYVNDDVGQIIDKSIGYFGALGIPVVIYVLSKQKDRQESDASNLLYSIEKQLLPLFDEGQLDMLKFMSVLSKIKDTYRGAFFGEELFCVCDGIINIYWEYLENPIMLEAIKQVMTEITEMVRLKHHKSIILMYCIRLETAKKDIENNK